MSVPYTSNVGPVDQTVKPDLRNLKGKNVLITGGSSGLGAAYVQAFLEAGAYVTNADVQPATSYDPSPGAKYHHIKCDVTSFADQVSAFKAAIALSPNKKLDIVIANAGISGADPVFALDANSPDPEEPDLKILRIDLIGPIYTAKCAMHYWQFDDRSPENKCLILKASLAGYLDLPAAPQYNAAKFGLRGLMANMRISGRCRVNIIAPWFIRTAIMSETGAAMISQTLEAVGGEWAQIEDAVDAVMRVASDEGVNGRALAVVPKSEVGGKVGWVDLERDDYEEGSVCARWVGMARRFGHRAPVPVEGTK